MEIHGWNREDLQHKRNAGIAAHMSDHSAQVSTSRTAADSNTREVKVVMICLRLPDLYQLLALCLSWKERRIKTQERALIQSSTGIGYLYSGERR